MEHNKKPADSVQQQPPPQSGDVPQKQQQSTNNAAAQQHSPKVPLQTNLPDLNKLQSSHQQPSAMYQPAPPSQTYDNQAPQFQHQQLTTGPPNQATIMMGNQQQQPQQQPQHQADFGPPTLQPPTIQPLLAPDSASVNNSTVINVPSNQQQQQQLPVSPQKSTITKVKLSDELNIFDWFRTTDILSQIAERARHSMESVITAVDPGMKEYLYSGGNINIMVICDSENLVSPIRDSFQTAFGRATVNAARYNSPELALEYPIRIANGFNEALQVAQERIRRLRLNTEMVPQNQVIVCVQPSIVCLSSDSISAGLSNGGGGGSSSAEASAVVQPKYQICYCMLIEDPVLLTNICSYSQLIPIDEDIVASARQVEIPENFRDQQHLGFATTLDDLMNVKLRLPPREAGDLEDSRWLKSWAGLSETKLMRDLSSALAHSYRRKWDECVN